jgi:hypothetical protein
MVRRKLVSLIGGAAFALPVALLGGFRAAPLEALGTPTVRVAEQALTGDVRVEWVVRTRDLLACQTATPDLRRLQHDHSARMELIVYAVDSDTALVRSFLRRERLARLQLNSITERQFQHRFAQRLGQPAQTPSLFVRAGDAQLAFAAGMRGEPGARGVADFMSYLGTLLTPTRLAGDHRSPSMLGGNER